jgi:uncharacterized protein (UPF0332 family)
MAEPYDTLRYVARLSAAQKAAAYAQDAAFPGSDLGARLRSAIEDVSQDRLIRAEGCLRVARKLRSEASGDEELLRTAIVRGYYSVHHAVRAICLRENQCDPDGHTESIEAFKKLLKDGDFRRRSGLPPEEFEAVMEARTNRHVADYSPYREQPSSTRLADNAVDRITDDDWERAADFNIALAGRLSAVALKLL